MGTAGVGDLADLGMRQDQAALWLIYVSYLVLRRFSSSAQDTGFGGGAGGIRSAGRATGVFLDLDFPHEHPQPVIGGELIHPRMLRVLLVNWLAFLCFAFLVCRWRYRLERLKRQVEETQALEAPPERQGPCDDLSLRGLRSNLGHSRGVSDHPCRALFPPEARDQRSQQEETGKSAELS